MKPHDIKKAKAMKAKEYAEKYRSWIGKRLCSDIFQGAPKGRTFDKTDGLICVCQEMLFEVSEIAKSRNTRSDRAIAAIMREQDRKYVAFVRLVPEADASILGFRKFAVNQLPKVARLLGWE
jgi:hypothetical protein